MHQGNLKFILLILLLWTLGDTHAISETMKVSKSPHDQHNIFLKVVRINESWAPYSAINYWERAVETKTSTALKYYEVAIWEETKSVHLYAFPNYDEYRYEKDKEGRITKRAHNFQSWTAAQRVQYREQYRLIKIDGLPSTSNPMERSRFLRDAMITMVNYIISAHPKSNHHLTYLGHGAPGGDLFEGQLRGPEVSEFLDHWTTRLGRKLGVIDMGGPCIKGSFSDLKRFSPYADYYIASDLFTGGGYRFDGKWSKEKFDETNPLEQYHNIFANSSNLKEALKKRIDVIQKRYNYSKRSIRIRRVMEATYLYSCASFQKFQEAFGTFAKTKREFDLGSGFGVDLYTYMAREGLDESFFDLFDDIFVHHADNRDFFRWPSKHKGILLDRYVSPEDFY